jgi:NitT/TauT family transport system substrate-binding protein
MKKNFHVIFTVLLISVLLSSCSGAQSASVSQPLNIAWTVWPGEYPNLIAQDMGFFEKRGLSVTLTLYDSQTPELADLQSGKIDGGVFSLTDTMAVSVNKPDVRIVMAVDVSEGADAIVATPDINTLADLKGKRIAANLGSQTEFFARYALKDNGISIGDVNLVDMDPEAVPAALGNQVAAGHTWDPYLSEAVAAGNHILFSSENAPGLLTDVFIFRKSIVDSRPGDVRAYVAAWFEALDYWQKNPEEGNAIIAKYTGLTADEISTEGIKLLTLEENRNAFKPGFDTTSLYYTAQLNLDFLVTIGAVSSALNVKEVIMPEFVQ